MVWWKETFTDCAHKQEFLHMSAARLRAFTSNYSSYRPLRAEEIGGGLGWLLHWGLGILCSHTPSLYSCPTFSSVHFQSWLSFISVQVKLLFFHWGSCILVYCTHTHTHRKAPGEVISLGLQLSEQQACVGGGSGRCRLTTHPPLGRFTCVCTYSGNNSPIRCVMGSLFSGCALMEFTFLDSNWNKINMQIVHAQILKCGYS